MEEFLIGSGGKSARLDALVLSKLGDPPLRVTDLTKEQWGELRTFLDDHSDVNGAKSAIARWARCDLKTISRHMEEAEDKISKRGRRPALPTEVENTIVSWLILMFQMCCCIPVAVLCAKVNELTYGTCYEGKIGGRGWVRAFLHRHKLSKRQAQLIERYRTTAISRANMDRYFNATLKPAIAGFPPCKIWNMDETGISWRKEHAKVSSILVALRGAEQV